MNSTRTAFETGKVQLPSDKTLSHIWLPKMDQIAICWDQYTWTQDCTRIGTIASDGTTLDGSSWLCTVCDDIDFPPSFTLAEKVNCNWSEFFSRRYEVLAQTGRGEGSRAHKVLALKHQCSLRAGVGQGFERFRWSRYAAIADQGIEKKMWDVPNITDVHALDTVTCHLEHEVADPANPDAYMWPRVLVWTGPMHIIYNALQTHVEGSEGWSEYLEKLRAVLSVIGDKSVSRRFLALERIVGPLRAALKAFSHNIVDWKWEYMEELFLHLDPIVEDFFQVYNAKALRAASGVEGSEQVLDQKGMMLLEKCKPVAWVSLQHKLHHGHVCFSVWGRLRDG